MTNKIKLYCLPCAGGSSSLYSKWNRHIKSEIEVVPIELKGRGIRIDEDFYENFDGLIDDVYKILSHQIKDSNYALLGFSMGGLVVYEIYKRLTWTGYCDPKHIFIIGREAPNYRFIRISHLPDEAFLKEIYSYQGIPDEIYTNSDLLNFILPQLRSDFEIYETYDKKEIVRTRCNLSVLYGEEDKSIIHEGIFMWKNFAGAECDFKMFEGGHFFISKMQDEVLSYIESKLKSSLELQN
jgi:surfactin synthase thioesterase subunit